MHAEGQPNSKCGQKFPENHSLRRQLRMARTRLRSELWTHAKGSTFVSGLTPAAPCRSVAVDPPAGGQ